MKISFFGKSVKGKDHFENEDNFLIDEKLRIFAVADGVSIPKGGKKASEKVLKYLKESFKGKLKEAVEIANKKFFEEKTKEFFEGYTTLSAVYVKENSIEACNVGDSPIFLLRKGKLELLAFLDKIPGTSTLTQAMGEEFVNVHSLEKELESGDYIILATDGITDALTEFEMIEIIEKFEDLEEICEKMIEEAGKKAVLYDDDKTLIVIKVEL
ncbi:MAG: serine/threonine-protein phosphatase [Candidatus Aenigmatarchaeota archaeon]